MKIAIRDINVAILYSFLSQAVAKIVLEKVFEEDCLVADIVAMGKEKFLW